MKFGKCLAKLNSVANTHGKGRDDFNAEILKRATAELYLYVVGFVHLMSLAIFAS